MSWISIIRFTFTTIAFLLLTYSFGVSARTCPTAPISNGTTGNSTLEGSGSDSSNFVFAHFMVGNSFPYTVEDWANDIQLALAHGIDAFALNVGTDSWQPDQVQNAFSAAENSTFKLFFSFDMSVLPCVVATDAEILRNYITKYATHPNQFLFQGKVLASTFDGASCTFGQSSVLEGWTSQFISQLTGHNEVFFVPAFFGDPSNFSTSGLGDILDGVFNWNSAWPIQVTSDVFSQLLNSVESAVTTGVDAIFSPGLIQLVHNLTSSLESDEQYISALLGLGGNKTYLASVSPWFFTHYGADSFNKNFVYLSDPLYPNRWQALVAARDKIPMVEIVTWNDYGESSYIGPIEGSQPNSQSWVDGMDHAAFLDMTQYFVAAYKQGTFPTLEEDKIYLWARTHPKDATASNDSVGKPQNFDVLEDAMFAMILATAPATVTLTASPSSSTTVNVSSGLTQVTFPLSGGDTMGATLTRNGKTVINLQPSNFTFNPSPATYNYNSFAVMSGSSSGNATSSVSKRLSRYKKRESRRRAQALKRNEH